MVSLIVLMVCTVYNLNHLNLLEHVIIPKQGNYVNRIIVILKTMLI